MTTGAANAPAHTRDVVFAATTFGLRPVLCGDIQGVDWLGANPMEALVEALTRRSAGYTQDFAAIAGGDLGLDERRQGPVVGV